MAELRAAGLTVLIQLDGEPVSFCVTYDVDEGWIEEFYKDASGRYVNDGENLLTRRRCGRVTVQLKGTNVK